MPSLLQCFRSGSLDELGPQVVGVPSTNGAAAPGVPTFKVVQHTQMPPKAYGSSAVNGTNGIRLPVKEAVAAAANGLSGSQTASNNGSHAVANGVAAPVNGTTNGHAAAVSADIMDVPHVVRCPFGHGSVGAKPFPGYVHGNHPGVCPAGCKPDLAIGKYGRDNETPQQTLMREMLEYQDLYHRENSKSDEFKAARLQEILAEIKATGTYTHTWDELQHGSRVAWRNAPKCCNRKVAMELKLIDVRDVTTNRGMYEACLELLDQAATSCVVTANILCFRPQTPGTQDGPRVWNNQLLRWCGWRQPDGSIVGDSTETEFTELVQEEYGWQGPPSGKRGRFDFLPLLLQIDPEQPPELFDVPEQYCPRVYIQHPEFPQFADLGLQWYSIPAVSSMELSVGGLTYTAVPFNGWYADTEILRNLTEEHRYNCLPAVAKCLGIDTRKDSSMWKDHCMVEVNKAIMYSFMRAGMGMIDHHTVMANFFEWYNKEMKTRGYAPGNWKWIITPMSPTTSPCYLQLATMTEFTLKPNYWYGPGWRKMHQRLTGTSDAADCDHTHGVQSAEVKKTDAGAKPEALLLYASVSGTTRKYLTKAALLLRPAFKVTLLDMEDYPPERLMREGKKFAFTAFALSTYGPGAPPASANKLILWLNKATSETLAGLPVCVLGFGASAYPRFCAAADLLSGLLAMAGTEAIIPVAKADALSGEEVSFLTWLKDLVTNAYEKGLIDEAAFTSVASQCDVGKGRPATYTPALALVPVDLKVVHAAKDANAQWVTVKEVKQLLGPNGLIGNSSTSLVIFDTTGTTGTVYLTGDECGIFAENDSALVQEFATQLGLSNLDEGFMFARARHANSKETVEQDSEAPEDALPDFPLPNSYGTILKQYTSLNDRISYEAIWVLSTYAPGDAGLQALANDYTAYEAWSNSTNARWSELFTEFPSLVLRLPAAVFFQIAPIIKSRHYSISSSSSGSPNELHITVSRLHYTLPDGRHRSGFTSSYLNSAQPGQRVRLFTMPTPAFRPPLNTAAPVIMICAGTGIAPFKGFIDDRLHRQSLPTAAKNPLGPCALVFGCRATDTDYLYQEKLKLAAEKGAITQLMIAFSRESGVPKTYVQDAIRSADAGFKTMLLHPRCHVYICGASNMASEVSAALSGIMGAALLDKMVAEARYHEDIFGVNLAAKGPAVLTAAASRQAVRTRAALPLQELRTVDFDVHAVDEHGLSLLHHAAGSGRADVVEYLLQKGAGLNVSDGWGRTPLQVAIVAGNEQIQKLLREAGGLQVAGVYTSFYLLHSAVQRGDEAEVAKLLSSGNQVNQPDYQGLTPLHLAVVLGHEGIARELLARGASPNASSRLGITPLQLAALHKRGALVTELRNAGGEMVAAGANGAAISARATHQSYSPESDTALGMTPEEVAIVEASWGWVAGDAFPEETLQRLEEAGVILFRHLFEQYPPMLAFFKFKDAEGNLIDKELRAHGLKVISLLGFLVRNLSNAEALTRYIATLVQTHLKYGVEPKHYDLLFATLRSCLGNIFAAFGGTLDAEQVSAWNKVLDIASAVVVDAYEKSGGISGKMSPAVAAVLDVVVSTQRKASLDLQLRASWSGSARTLHPY